jgi:subtilisin family serine protease
MNVIWQEADRERPDPYLDWEYRTRPLKQYETWCSVQIQVLPATDDDYLPSLVRLRDAVQAGSVPDDGVESGFFTIRMSDDERVNLNEWINAGGNAKEKIEMQFFIYRLESFIYRNGHYNDPSFYHSIFAGPPIVGLEFNDLNEEPSGIHFPELFVSDITAAIGVIDDGIAFAHQRFCNQVKDSRIGAIWLQETERRNKKDNSVVFGRRLDNTDINGYLQTCASEDEIYRQAGVTDFRSNIYNPLASRAAHGTHVLDLASGYDSGASDRPILAVQLPSVATIDTSGVTMGSYVLQAVRMIMLWANKLRTDGTRHVPLVINFSYGLLAGPKDGTQQLEKSLADLVDYRNRRFAPTRLVLPAGNSYRSKAAAKIELEKRGTKHLDWVIAPDDGTANYLEIWLDGEGASHELSPVQISLTPPRVASSYSVRLSEAEVVVLESAGGTTAAMYYDVFPLSGRERILLAIGPTVRNDDGRHLAPSGGWTVSIENLAERPITAHFYVQRDDTPFGYPRRGRQSHLDHHLAYGRDEKTGDYRVLQPHCPITYEETLSSIATGGPQLDDHPIVVGAAEATDHHPPADYTASGPTKLRDGPDNSAFADDGDAHWGRLAAGTFSGSVVAMRGTSVAAPQIARHIANNLAASVLHDTPTGAPGEVFIGVPDEDKARLGEYIYSPIPEPKIPQRRYPAVEELQERSDDRCGGE